MPSSWSKDELQAVLTHATPIVRRFLKGLADRGAATIDELGVSHMAAAIGSRYAKHRGKEPLYKSARDGTTGRSVFAIEPKYREDIARILGELQDHPAEPGTPSKRPTWLRKLEPAVPKRRPGRPRKIDVAVENLIGNSAPPKAAGKAKRATDCVTLPFGVVPDLQFWMQLVAMANEAVRRGTMLRFVSDGRDVTIEGEASSSRH